MKPRLASSSLFSQGRDGQEILLPQLFECVVPCLNYALLGIGLKALCLVGKQSATTLLPSLQHMLLGKSVTKDISASLELKRK